MRPLQDPSSTQTGQLEPYIHCILFWPPNDSSLYCSKLCSSLALCSKWPVGQVSKLTHPQVTSMHATPPDNTPFSSFALVYFTCSTLHVKIPCHKGYMGVPFFFVSMSSMLFYAQSTSVYAGLPLLILRHLVSHQVVMSSSGYGTDSAQQVQTSLDCCPLVGQTI